MDKPIKGVRVPPEALIESYKRTGSVWATGKEFGLAGQSVHKILRKHGAMKVIPPEFTQAQMARIQDYYTSTPPELFDLDSLAQEMGKDKTNVCRFARRRGWTQQNRPCSTAHKQQIKLSRKDFWKEREHPRGFRGGKHTDEAKAKISAFAKKHWITCKTFGIGWMSPETRKANRDRLSKLAATRDGSKVYSRAKGGKREDIGDIWFRSSWEANYARYLNLLIKMKVVEYWEYEAETFWFPVKRGTVSYRPDFRIKYVGDPKREYVEIKGWITAKDRTKWKRMAIHHPHVKLIVIGAKQYYAIRDKWSSAIPTWEFPKKQEKKKKG